MSREASRAGFSKKKPRIISAFTNLKLPRDFIRKMVEQKQLHVQDTPLETPTSIQMKNTFIISSN